MNKRYGVISRSSFFEEIAPFLNDRGCLTLTTIYFGCFGFFSIWSSVLLLDSTLAFHVCKGIPYHRERDHTGLQAADSSLNVSHFLVFAMICQVRYHIFAVNLSSQLDWILNLFGVVVCFWLINFQPSLGFPRFLQVLEGNDTISTLLSASKISRCSGSSSGVLAKVTRGVFTSTHVSTCPATPNQNL